MEARANLEARTSTGQAACPGDTNPWKRKELLPPPMESVETRWKWRNHRITVPAASTISPRIRSTSADL